jgi:hypothetical protein
MTHNFFCPSAHHGACLPMVLGQYLALCPKTFQPVYFRVSPLDLVFLGAKIPPMQ